MERDADRRFSRRYPIENQVCYRVRGPRVELVGKGTTMNMSSRGALFTTDQPLAAGSRLTLEVKWPVLLDNTLGLKLVTQGKVIWCDSWRAAVEFHDWEFHTRGSSRA
jgi:hypothetical protein